jgi:chemotaxis protein MotB
METTVNRNPCTQHDQKQGKAFIAPGALRPDDESHRTAWKLLFADFCLALMALFLVLWVLAARHQQALQQAVHDATSGLAHGPGCVHPQVSCRPAESEARRQATARAGECARCTPAPTSSVRH